MRSAVRRGKVRRERKREICIYTSLKISQFLLNVYIYTHADIQTLRCTHRLTHTQTQTHTHIQTHMQTLSHTLRHIYSLIHTHRHTDTPTQTHSDSYTQQHRYTHICTTRLSHILRHTLRTCTHSDTCVEHSHTLSLRHTHSFIHNQAH